MRYNKLLLAIVLLFEVMDISSQPHIIKDIEGVNWGVGTKFRVINNLYFFSCEIDGKRQVWRSDGSSNGTYKILESRYSYPILSNFCEYNGFCYFIFRIRSGKVVLYKTDGTPNGTFPVDTLFYFDGNYSAAMLVNINDKLVFLSKSNGNTQIWNSSGVHGTTFIEKEIEDVEIQPTSFIVYHNKIIFSTHSHNLWITDGSDNGTYLFFDGILSLKETIYNGKLYLHDINPTIGKLYEYDGNLDYPNLILTLPYGIDDVNSTDYALFILTNIDEYNYIVWKSDGTENGTFSILNIENERIHGIDDNPEYLTDLRSLICQTSYFVFFTTYTGEDNIGHQNMYVSNGSHTEIIKNIDINACYSLKYDNKILFGSISYHNPWIRVKPWNMEDIEIIDYRIVYKTIRELNNHLIYVRSSGGLWETDNTAIGYLSVKENIINSIDISFSPNPTAKDFYIQNNTDLKLKGKFELLTISGRLINSFNLDLNKQEKVLFTPSVKRNGVYIGKLTLEDGRVISKKIIIKG